MDGGRLMAEYYAPGVSRHINGPVKIEFEGKQIGYATGLRVTPYLQLPPDPHPTPRGCCTACEGTGHARPIGHPCEDCYATGCAHPPPLCTEDAKDGDDS
jgi:hypothetical protein